MRTIDTIIIHCAATKPKQDIGVKEIDGWHRQRGFKKIGYHYVIRRDGTVEKGRDNAEVGAHATNRNARSIGICLVGGLDDAGKPANNFTPVQWDALLKLVREVKEAYGVKSEKIIGHNQVSNKACPCFRVPAWRVKAGL